MSEINTFSELRSELRVNALSSFVHRENIKRYKRLLKTSLTVIERAFIQQRLSEEKEALAKSACLNNDRKS